MSNCLMPSSSTTKARTCSGSVPGLQTEIRPGSRSGRAQAVEPFQRLRQRAAAFEVDPVLVVDLGRAVEADGDVHVVRLEQLDPFVIDQDAVGGDAALDEAAGALFDRAQLFHAARRTGASETAAARRREKPRGKPAVRIRECAPRDAGRTRPPLPASAPPASCKPRRRETSSNRCN